MCAASQFLYQRHFVLWGASRLKYCPQHTSQSARGVRAAASADHNRGGVSQPAAEIENRPPPLSHLPNLARYAILSRKFENECVERTSSEARLQYLDVDTTMVVEGKRCERGEQGN